MSVRARAAVRRWSGRAGIGLFACSTLAIGPQAAFAYRPFDGTDAAVVARGEVEIEFQPVGYLLERGTDFLVVPAFVVNIGVAGNCEIVFEGRGFVALREQPGSRRSSLDDTGLSFKAILRRGSLQGGRGPSVAAEVGALLPTVRGESGVGAVGAVIVSQRGRWLTVHLNAQAALARNGRLESVGGAILEGGSRWRLRPVLEVVVRHEPDATRASGLVGAIVQVSDTLALDAGVRLARSDRYREREVRAGLTWAFAGAKPAGSATGRPGRSIPESCWLGRPVAARLPCCGSSPDSPRRIAAPSASAARRSRPTG